jgi:hypothetical protein
MTLRPMAKVRRLDGATLAGGLRLQRRAQGSVASSLCTYFYYVVRHPRTHYYHTMPANIVALYYRPSTSQCYQILYHVRCLYHSLERRCGRKPRRATGGVGGPRDEGTLPEGGGRAHHAGGAHPRRASPWAALPFHAVVGYHWLWFRRDLYSSLAAIAAIFCQNDSAAHGYM